MPYRITIELNENELRIDDATRVVNYLKEVIETMGYSYSIDCSKDGMKVMMGLESPAAEENSQEKK